MYPSLAEREWKHFNEDILLHIMADEEIFESEKPKISHMEKLSKTSQYKHFLL